METIAVNKIQRHSECLKLKYALVGLILLCSLPNFVQTIRVSDNVDESDDCPIGFIKKGEVCYQIKSRETSDQKYDRCSGNEVAIDFYKDYKFLAGEGKNSFWTDYVRAYSNGPFVNWRIGDKDIGKPIDRKLINHANETGKLCAIVDLSSQRIIPENCNERYSRLCVIRPYSNTHLANWNCPRDYMHFASPIPACLKEFSENEFSTRRVAVRATWRQSLSICERILGHLPHRGYVYINHPEFNFYNAREVPLGIRVEAGMALWTGMPDNESLIPSTEWNFNMAEPESKDGIVFLQNSKWKVTENPQVYNNVICEYFVELPVLQLNYSGSEDEMLIFTVNKKINVDSDIQCFTDSVTFHPTRIHPVLVNTSHFGIPTARDGFYWCTVSNSWEYATGYESERVLFVRDSNSLKDIYAIKVVFNSTVYTLEELNADRIVSELSDAILPYDPLFQTNLTESAPHGVRKRHAKGKMLMKYTESFERVFFDITVKGIYDDFMVLIHAKMASTNFKGNGLFQVEYLRKVLTCEANNDAPETELGLTFYNKSTCTRYHCAGNFNIGAYWLEGQISKCTIQPPTTTPFDEDSGVTPTGTATGTTGTPTTPEMQTTTITTTTTENTGIPENQTTSETTTFLPDTTTVFASTLLTTPSPDDFVNSVIDTIDDILSGPINSSSLEVAASLINDVLSLEDGVTIPSKILHSLESMVSKMVLSIDQSHVEVVQPNLAIMVTDRKGDKPATGIKVNSNSESFDNSSMEVLTAESEIGENEENDIFVKIPLTLGDNPHARLSFVVFRNDRAFNPNSTQNFVEKINTRVLSISLANLSVFEDGDYVDIHLRPYESLKKNETKKCAFWNFNSGPNGKWSTEGCELLKTAGPGGLDTCRCYHLTHFAQLITTNSNNMSDSDNDTLTIISFVGCIFSLIGLVFIGFTGVLFRSWRSDFINKVWLHLSGAVAIMIIAFLCIAFVDFRESNTAFCIVAGVALHYSVLASFCWMLIAAILSYQRLVTVFTRSTSHRLLKASIFGWVCPMIPIAILFAVNTNSYTQHFAMSSLKNEFCYPSGLGFWLAVFLPVVLVVVCNTLLFSSIIYSVFISSKIKRHGDNKQLFRSVTVGFLLFYLFGLTWVFGLFSNNLVMAYLFCITATLQGVVLCIFFVVGNKKARDLWLVKLHLKEVKKIPITTSISRSYPSKSSHMGRPIRSKTIDGESTTKPRSLIGNNDKNDSRFS